MQPVPPAQQCVYGVPHARQAPRPHVSVGTSHRSPAQHVWSVAPQGTQRGEPKVGWSQTSEGLEHVSPLQHAWPSPPHVGVGGTHVPDMHVSEPVHAGQHAPAGHTHVVPMQVRPPVHAGEQPTGPESMGVMAASGSTIAASSGATNASG